MTRPGTPSERPTSPNNNVHCVVQLTIVTTYLVLYVFAYESSHLNPLHQYAKRWEEGLEVLARVPIWLPTVLAVIVFVGGIVVMLVVAATGHADGFPAKTFAAGAILLSFLLAMSTVLVDRARRNAADTARR